MKVRYVVYAIITALFVIAGLILWQLGLIEKGRIYVSKAPQYYAKGIALEKKGDLDGALQAFEEAIARYPNYAEAHFSLAKILHRQAENLFDQAIELRAEVKKAGGLMAFIVKEHVPTKLDRAIALSKRSIVEARATLNIDPEYRGAKELLNKNQELVDKALGALTEWKREFKH